MDPIRTIGTSRDDLTEKHDLIAFFENVQWDEVSRRLERARAAARAMKA